MVIFCSLIRVHAFLFRYASCTQSSIESFRMRECRVIQYRTPRSKPWRYLGSTLRNPSWRILSYLGTIYVFAARGSRGDSSFDAGCVYRVSRRAAHAALRQVHSLQGLESDVRRLVSELRGVRVHYDRERHVRLHGRCRTRRASRGPWF